jgi:hypothetical protein
MGFVLVTRVLAQPVTILDWFTYCTHFDVSYSNPPRPKITATRRCSSKRIDTPNDKETCNGIVIVSLAGRLKGLL